MDLLIEQPTFTGSMYIPPSKSHTIRALLCASCANGSSYITGPLQSGDTDTAVKIFRKLGVSISRIQDNPLILEVRPNTHKYKNVLQKVRETPYHLNLENSGSLLYFLGAVLAASPIPFCLSGDASLNRRPVEPLAVLYRQGGIAFTASADAAAGTVPPLSFCGPFRSRSFELYGPFSQPVSGMLFAAPLLNGRTRIVFRQPGELPYIKMTCEWLKTAGIDAAVSADGCLFEIEGSQSYRPFSKKIPGDWSSAAFPIAAALATGQRLVLHNLDIHDVQGDKEFLHIVRQMGGTVHSDTACDTLTIEAQTKPLKGITYHCADTPDLVPVLAALACFAQGRTVLTGTGVCRHKECDRLSAAAEELGRCGAEIAVEADCLVIHGKQGENLHPADVASRNDHRIAMMLAAAACGITARRPAARMRIQNVGCVAVSYPTFFEDFNRAGARFTLM